MALILRNGGSQSPDRWLKEPRNNQIENDISTLSIDLLVNLANYFNVTTDYILGISDLKRGLEGQLKENKLLDKYEDIIFFIEKLNDRDKKLMLVICQSMLRLDEGNNYD